MPRDSRCRLARGYGSPQIPAAAQGAIQSNQIGGDRRLTLYELIFVCVKAALCIQHRQKIYETCFVLLGREIHGQLAVRYRIVEAVAALLFLRIADQGVLDLFESVENCGLIADHGLPLARGLYGDVRTYAATSEQGQTDTRTNRKKVSCAQREIMELSGLTSRRPSEYKGGNRSAFASPIRAVAAASCASLRRMSGRLFRRSEGKPTSISDPAEGIGFVFSSSLRSAPGSSPSRTLKR